MKTREEEILKEAEYRYNVQHPFIDIAKASFIEGAKWADETMIEKACSWLDRALDNFYIGTQQANFTDKVKFIESFKKAMRNRL